jgi:hypothetical protein
MRFRKNESGLLVGFLIIFVLAGSGCIRLPDTTPVDVSLRSGDSLTVRKTVFGIGGSLAELFGVHPDERAVSVRDAWPDTTSGYSNDTFVLLPKSVYQELADTGSTHLSLGMFDETVSEAMSWVDRLNALASSVGVTTGLDANGEDVLLVTRTDDDATDWVRIDGTLQPVRTIKASNRFASYVILANPENPIILSLSLTPAARAQFDVLASFEGFEVSEINHFK